MTSDITGADSTSTDISSSNISITESAQAYLVDLLAKQEKPGIGVRIFVEHAGTPRAECCMAYSLPGEAIPSDIEVVYSDFSAFMDAPSLPYLQDAVIDYNKDRFGGQLTFKAPNSKVPRVGADASIEERINYVLQAEINPSLASHGGNVMLVEVLEQAEVGLTAILKFGGGCQGCSAVDMTLKQGVETTLMQQIPEIKAVKDQTDHSVKDAAYFK